MSELVTPCCSVEPDVTARVSVKMPLDLFRGLTKQAFKSKDVQIEAVDWERAIWSCPGCHRIWAPGEDPWNEGRRSCLRESAERAWEVGTNGTGPGKLYRRALGALLSAVIDDREPNRSLSLWRAARILNHRTAFGDFASIPS